MTERKEIQKRWLANRFDLEKTRRKKQRNRGILPRFWKLFNNLITIFGQFLKVIGFYEQGLKNALDIKLNSFELSFPNLPGNFHGYTILHLTDLHLDIVNNLEDEIIRVLRNNHVDLCVMTGDYRRETYGEFRQILKPMKKLMAHISAKDGILLTLGNHDTYLMVKPLVKMGFNVITNETIRIEKKSQFISITGIDDVHYYYSEDAVKALSQKIEGFKITLIHSPELYDVAADNNYDLYLCGHTHAGQICLPGGIPVITHLSNGKKFYKGLWEYKNMKGYTGNGTGTSGIPVRYNSESEITLITLKKSAIS